MAIGSFRTFLLAALAVLAVAAAGAWLASGSGDEEAWQLASAADTQEAYERYVSEWSSGAFVGDANERIAALEDERAWRRAIEEDTAEGYFLYQLNTSGKYLREARERRAVLVEAADWTWARKEGTREAFSEYARKWPEGPNISAAKDRLREFDLRAKYREAAALDTIRALETFVLSHPDAPDAEQARERAEALKRDDAPFVTAHKKGSAEALEQFLRDYPGHVRTGYVRRALTDLKGVDIFRLVDEKRVSISIKGGGLTRAQVTLTNNGDSAVSAIIPAAIMFASRNRDIQNMVTTSATLVTLKPNETKSLSVPVACANLPRRAPGSSSELFLEQVANQPALKRVVWHMQAVELPFEVRQAAVWIVTDDATYQGLSRLKTMRPGYAMRALRLLEETGIELGRFSIWHEGARLFRDHIDMAGRRSHLNPDRNVESQAIWFYERLDRYLREKDRAFLEDGLLNQVADVGWGDMIQLLVKKEHDVNQRDELKRTPLHNFIRYTKYQPLSDPEPTVKALIGAGADVDARDGRGRTPIFFASPGAAFEVLAAAGADLNVADETGLTLAHVLDLKRHKNSKALDILSDVGLDINQADKDGNTPLHRAVRAGDENKIRALIRLGALALPNHDGKRPLDIVPKHLKGRAFEKLLKDAAPTTQ